MVTSPDVAELERELTGITAPFSGRVGYAIADLATGAELLRQADDWFPTASAIKLPLLTVVHDAVVRGELAWDERLRVPTDHRPGGSGVLQFLDEPRDLSLKNTAWLMICVSDNVATNMIINRIGFDLAMTRLDALGGGGMRLDKPAGDVGAEPRPSRSMGRATPAAMLAYLRGLYAGRLVGAREALALAGQQQSRSGLGRYLTLVQDVPAGTVPHSTVAGKPGALPGIRTDVGVITSSTGRSAALAVFTDASIDTTYGAEHEGERCIGAIARAVHRCWLEQAA